MSRSRYYFYSSGEDDDPEAQNYCSRVAETLDSRVSFSQSPEAPGELGRKAGQGGGAKRYTSFLVDSFEDEDEFSLISGLTLSLPSTNQPCTVTANSDHTHRREAMPKKSNTPGNYEDGDDGWNSSDSTEFRQMATPTSGKLSKMQPHTHVLIISGYGFLDVYGHLS